MLSAPGKAGGGLNFLPQKGDSRGLSQFGVTDAFLHSCPAIEEDENDLKWSKASLYFLSPATHFPLH